MRRWKLDYVPQLNRPNRHKPSVAWGPFGGWVARGYDAHNHLHVETNERWLDAVSTALRWAREGYPAP